MERAPLKIPRKLKKKLKKTIWHYPEDEKGDSLMAFPHKYLDDFRAYKAGKLRDLFASANKATKGQELDKPVAISDEELKACVNNIIHEDFKSQSFRILKSAKTDPRAVKAYYNFINAYRLYQGGDKSFGNICCLAIDRAKKLMRKR